MALMLSSTNYIGSKWKLTYGMLWMAYFNHVKSSKKSHLYMPHRKKPDAFIIIDYRPISLCNVSYKILANLLCNRPKPYMNDLTSYNQNAFILGRLIFENSLLAYEMVRGFYRKNSNNLCLKIDLNKAYDKISRAFIHHMLLPMGFPTLIANLTYECMPFLLFLY